MAKKELKPLNNKPVVLTMANRKGGVAKTTNTVNLGFALAQKGYRTLLIDADPQGSLTQLLGIDRTLSNSPEISISNIGEVSRQLRAEGRKDYFVDDLFGNPTPGEEELSSYTGLHNLITNAYYGTPISRSDVDTAIVTPTYKYEIPKSERENVEGTISLSELEEIMYRKIAYGFDLIPASEELTDDELLISLDQDKRRVPRKGHFMEAVIEGIAHYRDYDFILIDTGPSLSIMTIASLAAARDGVIISAANDEQSLWSLRKFKYNMRQIKQFIPGHEGVLGVVMSAVDERSQMLPIVENKITQSLNMYLFRTRIPKSANVAKAIASNVIYALVDKRAFKTYSKLADEVIERLDANHKWEVQRGELVAQKVSELKIMPQYQSYTDAQLIEVVRTMYTNNELWSMPTASGILPTDEDTEEEIDEETEKLMMFDTTEKESE